MCACNKREREQERARKSEKERERKREKERERERERVQKAKKVGDHVWLQHLLVMPTMAAMSRCQGIPIVAFQCKITLNISSVEECDVSLHVSKTELMDRAVAPDTKDSGFESHHLQNVYNYASS